MSDKDLLIRIDERVNALTDTLHNIEQKITELATIKMVEEKIAAHNSSCGVLKLDLKKILIIVLMSMGVGSASGASVAEMVKTLF